MTPRIEAGKGHAYREKGPLQVKLTGGFLIFSTTTGFVRGWLRVRRIVISSNHFSNSIRQ